MADQNINNMTVTWNSGGTTFDAIKMNVTDTASAAASKLLLFQVGGTDKFAVGKDGSLTIAGGLTIGGTFTIGTVDINGGTIDGTSIGASVRNTLAATSGDFSTTLTVHGRLSGKRRRREPRAYVERVNVESGGQAIVGPVKQVEGAKAIPDVPLSSESGAFAVAWRAYNPSTTQSAITQRRQVLEPTGTAGPVGVPMYASYNPTSWQPKAQRNGLAEAECAHLERLVADG